MGVWGGKLEGSSVTLRFCPGHHCQHCLPSRPCEVTEVHRSDLSRVSLLLHGRAGLNPSLFDTFLIPLTSEFFSCSGLSGRQP